MEGGAWQGQGLSWVSERGREGGRPWREESSHTQGSHGDRAGQVPYFSASKPPSRIAQQLLPMLAPLVERPP